MNSADHDRLLTETLHRIADRAQPPADLAERALRRSARRRRARALAGAAAIGAAAAVAAPPLFFGDGAGPGPAPLASPGTSAVSPDEQRIVRACLQDGPPVGRKEDRRLPEKGMPADYRILVSTPAGSERVLSVGSHHGFVLCAMQAAMNTEFPVLRPWPGDSAQGLWSFPGKLRVDSADHLTRVGRDGRGFSNRLHHVVTGRYKTGVARIEVVWNNDRRVDAALRDGHFLARVDSGFTDEVDEDGFRYIQDDRIRSITAFDAAGKALQRWKAPGKGLTAFDPNTCEDSGEQPLCSD